MLSSRATVPSAIPYTVNPFRGHRLQEILPGKNAARNAVLAGKRSSNRADRGMMHVCRSAPEDNTDCGKAEGTHSWRNEYHELSTSQ